MPKLRNILIFVAIGAVLVLVYIFFIRKPSPPETTLVSSPLVFPATSAAVGVASTSAGANTGGAVAQDFLTLLLSVKNIKLDDTILSDVAFTSLDGTHSITLTPDGTEGRPNPFAPLGSDTALSSDSAGVSISTTTPNLTSPTTPTLPPTTPPKTTPPAAPKP